MSELKPCPFCGSEDVVRLSHNDRADIERCRNCNLSIIVPLGITMWNTRPIEDALNNRIAELEAERRWIPVREQMPTSGTQWVLLKNGKMDFDFTYIDGGRHYWWRNGSNVTHWMPLPELPEAQE